MSIFADASSVIGFFIIAARLVPTLRYRASVPSASANESVSVIVPARNEESNLPPLLKSLAEAEKIRLEVIIVDDASTDRTAKIVEEFSAKDSRFRLVRAAARPEGWSGKNWACHEGSKVASGKWLLFTDADTTHARLGIHQSFSKMKIQNLDMLSAIPRHGCPTVWEKLLGPFQLMVLISSAAFLKPKPNQLFAIGQFLLFRRDAYDRQGGHEAIKESLADDLDLANACVRNGGNYGVEQTGEIFEVRMYASFNEFVQGWRRIFRLGFAHANLARVIEIYFIIACLMMSFSFSNASAIQVTAALGGLFLFIVAQRRYGGFSWLGPVAMPFGLGLFVYISILGFLDRLLRRDLNWRGRSYKSSVAQRHDLG